MNPDAINRTDQPTDTDARPLVPPARRRRCPRRRRSRQWPDETVATRGAEDPDRLSSNQVTSICLLVAVVISMETTKKKKEKKTTFSSIIDYRPPRGPTDT